MNKDKSLNLLDLLIVVVQWKKFLIITLFLTLVSVYLLIFFFVEEQYTSNALVIPIQEEGIGGLAGLMGGISGGGLPFDIGGFSNPEISMYNTIIYSRTNLQNIVDEFNLVEVYNLDSSDVEFSKKAVTRLSEDITAEETENLAFEISVDAPSPQLAADITNYIIATLNEKILELKISKSRQNRIFLQNRVYEIKQNLKIAEDSLLYYQQETGILNPEEQIKGIMQAYANLETELITSEIEKSILENIWDENSPQLQKLDITIDEYEKKINELKEKGEDNGILLSLKSLPEKTLNYFRYLREVEVNSRILEFILPLYEQAKLEEQKDIPVLKVIDYGIPPAKKSFPRVYFYLY